MKQGRNAEPKETLYNGNDNVAEIPLLKQGRDLLMGRRPELETGNNMGADNQEDQGVICLQRFF